MHAHMHKGNLQKYMKLHYIVIDVVNFLGFTVYRVQNN